jgi:hypothetical protein
MKIKNEQVTFSMPKLTYEWKENIIISYSEEIGQNFYKAHYYVSTDEIEEIDNKIKEFCRLTITHTIAGDISKLNVFYNDYIIKDSYSFNLVKSLLDIFCETHIVELNFENII